MSGLKVSMWVKRDEIASQIAWANVAIRARNLSCEWVWRCASGPPLSEFGGGGCCVPPPLAAEPVCPEWEVFNSLSHFEK